MIYYMYKSDFGIIQIQIVNNVIGTLTMIENEFVSPKVYETTNLNATSCEKELLEKTIIQLDEYFNGKRKNFDLPLNLEYSPFRKRVYEVLRTTKSGEVYTYKDVATMAGSPRAARAVGTAMKNNPYAILIPCHRVIKSSGEYGRFFHNDSLKEKLIKFEKGDK